MEKEKKLGQHEKIIARMIEARRDQTWWKADDFMLPALDKSHKYFVGYEAGARMSELHKKFPQIITAMYEKRRRMIRFRFDNVSPLTLKDLPADMRGVIKRGLNLV